jgi:hypothetical protein
LLAINISPTDGRWRGGRWNGIMMAWWPADSFGMSKRRRPNAPTVFAAYNLPTVLRFGFGDRFPLHVRDGIESAANQGAPMVDNVTLPPVRMAGHLPKLVLNGS